MASEISQISQEHTLDRVLFSKAVECKLANLLKKDFLRLFFSKFVEGLSTAVL